LSRREVLTPPVISLTGLSGTTTNSSSYLALRVCPRVTAEAWWAAARKRRDAPPAVGALIAGRTRVEVTEAEAAQALAWAGGIDGWGELHPKPLFVHGTGAWLPA
jgi:hypothetical protein